MMDASIVSNLIFPGENNEAGQVIVRSVKANHSETREIPLASFGKICRVFTIQMRIFLRRLAIINCPVGGMNL